MARMGWGEMGWDRMGQDGSSRSRWAESPESTSFSSVLLAKGTNNPPGKMFLEAAEFFLAPLGELQTRSKIPSILIEPEYLLTGGLARHEMVSSLCGASPSRGCCSSAGNKDTETQPGVSPAGACPQAGDGSSGTLPNTPWSSAGPSTAASPGITASGLIPALFPRCSPPCVPRSTAASHEQPSPHPC